MNTNHIMQTDKIMDTSTAEKKSQEKLKDSPTQDVTSTGDTSKQKHWSAHWQIWAKVAVGIYICRTLFEMLVGTAKGLLSRPQVERPKIHGQATVLNRYFLDKCPSFQSYTVCPWAPGPVSQTVLGLAFNTGSLVYQRRELVCAPDGVELLIDWKEDPDLPDDAPILFILHGIGGGSDSRFARHLSDVAKSHGWRAAVYNRRGHGQSSVLPGPIAPLQPDLGTPPRRLPTISLPTPLALLKDVVPSSVVINVTTAATTAAAVVRERLALIPQVLTTCQTPGTSSPTTSCASATAAVQFCDTNRESEQHIAGFEDVTPAVETEQGGGVSLGDGSVSVGQVVTAATALESDWQIVDMPLQDVEGTTDILEGNSQVKRQSASFICRKSNSGQVGGQTTEKIMDVSKTVTSMDINTENHETRASNITTVNSLQIYCQQSTDQQEKDTTLVGSLNMSISAEQPTEAPTFTLGMGASNSDAGVSTTAAGLRKPVAVQQHTEIKRTVTPPSVRSSKRGASPMAEPMIPAIPPIKLRRTESLKQVKQVFPRHSDTDDLAQVVAHVKASFPDAPIVALGFSQGSNALVHFLGLHAHEPPPFAAAISVSNAYDLNVGVNSLAKDWVSDAIVTRPIKRLLKKELEAVQQLASAHGIALDVGRALSTHSIREFDEALLVPAFGFKNVEEYYNNQSSKEVLQDVRLPLLLINNTDDPIIDDALPDIAAAAAATNPWLLAVCTHKGGHLGWLQGWKGTAWLSDAMMQFAKAAVAAEAEGLIDKGAAATKAATVATATEQQEQQ